VSTTIAQKDAGDVTRYCPQLLHAVLQEVGFKDAFWPLFAMDDAEPNTLTNIALRASFALLAAGVSWVLYANSPDKGMLPYVAICKHACVDNFTY